MAKQLVVDADGHVLEPPDLWERYLEPRYRDRAMRIKLLDNGDEYLEVDRKMHFFGPGAMGGNGGAFLDPHDIIDKKMKYWETATKYTPGGIDPDARVAQMDEEGIDIALLYPTIGLCWEGECHDPELSAAYCRAYNNFLFDFCSKHPDRLIPIAHVALRDVNLAAAEVQRVKGKAKGIFITPYPVNGCPPGDRHYDPFWAACEAANLPVASLRPDPPFHPRRRASCLLNSRFRAGLGLVRFGNLVHVHAASDGFVPGAQLRLSGRGARALSPASIRGAGNRMRLAARMAGAGRWQMGKVRLHDRNEAQTQRDVSPELLDLGGG